MTHSAYTKHTIAIFEYLVANLPPLVPVGVVEDMAAALEQLKHNPDLSAVEVEDTMIIFGKKIWPFRQAFLEFVDSYQGELGDRFLSGRLSLPMKHRYEQYKEHGGTFSALFVGAPAAFFEPHERQELAEALVDVQKDLDIHTRQHICGMDRVRYEDRVVEFQGILADMEQRLDLLRQMADNEQEHPEFAAEVRAQIRAFEEGVCLLHTPPSHRSVCELADHVHGRREIHQKRN